MAHQTGIHGFPPTLPRATIDQPDRLPGSRLVVVATCWPDSPEGFPGPVPQDSRPGPGSGPATPPGGPASPGEALSSLLVTQPHRREQLPAVPSFPFAWSLLLPQQREGGRESEARVPPLSSRLTVLWSRPHLTLSFPPACEQPTPHCGPCPGHRCESADLRAGQGRDL
ncbi:hypothetical protein MDA_GLEAN10023245 [Myotis davidii]|uniref:Uncharacterized protein n=1 Tax=Myotis davidii TaxID=225400 RepID=L5LFW3_MYODS|nr:hypothetical protein MDA_GLEAN10023245 [Myotis davidii]